MLAATPNILTIGEKVEIKAVAGHTVKAMVRRKHGAMYGFEFIGLSDDLRERIRNICRNYRCSEHFGRCVRGVPEWDGSTRGRVVANWYGAAIFERAEQTYSKESEITTSRRRHSNG